MPDLVVVTWRDAWFDFDQPDPEEIRDDYLVTTVGYVVRNGPRFVSLAQEILPDGDGYRAVTHIPRSVICDVRTIEVGVEARTNPETEATTPAA